MTYSCIFSEQFIRRPQHSWSCKWDQAHLHNGPLRFRITQLRRKDNVARESSWYYSIIENCHANSQPSISTTSSRCCPFDRHNFLCAKAGKFLRGPLRIGPIAFPQKLMLLVAKCLRFSTCVRCTCCHRGSLKAILWVPVSATHTRSSSWRASSRQSSLRA